MPALSLRLFDRCGSSLTSRLQGCLRIRHFGLEIQFDGSRIWHSRRSDLECGLPPSTVSSSAKARLGVSQDLKEPARDSPIQGPGNALEAWAAAESRGRSPKRARPKAGTAQGWMLQG